MADEGVSGVLSPADSTDDTAERAPPAGPPLALAVVAMRMGSSDNGGIANLLDGSTEKSSKKMEFFEGVVRVLPPPLLLSGAAVPVEEAGGGS